MFIMVCPLLCRIHKHQGNVRDFFFLILLSCFCMTQSPSLYIMAQTINVQDFGTYGISEQ